FIFFILLNINFSCTKEENTDQNSTQYGKGYKANSSSSLEKVDEADINDNMFNLPSAFSIEGPPIIQQGATSQCVAFSGAYYIISMYNGVKNSQNNRATSPQFAYTQYKIINKDNNCSDGAFLFNDSANGVVGMAEILKQYGTTSWSQTPFVNDNICITTNSTQLLQASSNKISDYYRLDKTEFLKTGELKSWLYAGFPLWFAVDIDAGFQNLTTNIWNKASGKNEGGHAMVIVGYDDSKNAFKFANSWGEDWGDKGYGWVDYTYLTSLLNKEGTEIGILYPNDSQREVFNKLSPSSCGNAGWGELLINNQLNQVISIEISQGATYNYNKPSNIDSKDSEQYSGIPIGDITIKIYVEKKITLFKTYTVNIAQCEQSKLTVN
ncbi:MAG: C1 family peptidase, partial [Sediminibacterium sp.]|nr:C1 family peptidase [Sediminibacterium sp.]